MYSSFVMDEDGVPMYPYKSGLEYNITFVCHFALYHLSLYQRFGMNGSRDRFLRLSEWLSARGKVESGALRFYYHIEVPGLASPWISALGQGRAISVFTRAFEETADERFIDLAKQAVLPMGILVRDGGVQSTFPDGGIALEEYPREKPDLALNGMITAIFGIADLARLGCEYSGELFQVAVAALKDNVHRYALSTGSLYDLSGPVPRVASWEYHRYHSMQLWALYEMTGIEIFEQLARTWAGQVRGIRWHVVRNAFRTVHRLVR